jgi:hypothetical protein
MGQARRGDKRLPEALSWGMVQKLSAGANLRIGQIGEFLTKVARLHGLVEQYAAAKANPGQYEMPAMRNVQQLKLQFMSAGFDSLSQLCGGMEMSIRRGGSQVAKAKTLREGVATLKFQLELAARSTKSEDLQLQQRAEDAKNGN